MNDTQRIREKYFSFLRARRAEGRSKDTIDFYSDKLEPFVRFCEAAGVMNVEDIDADFFRRWLLHLEEKGNNPGGRHAFYRAARAFLRWYESEYEPEGWHEPTKKVRAPKVDIEPLPPVEIDTVRAMLETCKSGEYVGARDKAIIIILMDTGARRGELMAVDMADLDQDTGAIMLRHTKARKARAVYLGKVARLALRRWLKFRGTSGGALFTVEGGTRLSFGGLRGVLKRRADLAGVPEPGAHDFRRAFAIQAWRAGLDAVTIGRLLGHSSTEVTKRYLRFEAADLQAAALRVSPGDKL